MPLKIIRNDLLKMEVDAIVNPTDRRLSGAGSIDLKIHRAGGEELKRELASFGRCNVGDAVLTHAYNLPCEYIIHTVGPIWNGDEKTFKVIECCYRNCLELALSYDIESIAFPLIATGSFGCPTDKAIQIAINTINSFLIDDDLDVYLVVYNSEAFGISQKLVEDVKSYIEADIVEDAIDFPSTPYLGLWSRPYSDAPLLCIEPWHGLPSFDGIVDDIETKTDMYRLLPLHQKDFALTYTFG